MSVDIFKIGTIAATSAGVIIVMRDKKTPSDKKLQYAGIVVGTGLAALGGKALYDNWKRKKDLQTSSCENINLNQTATEIYTAFFKNDIFGMTENDEAAFNSIKVVPKSCINSLAMVYNKMYNRNLREDLSFLLDAEYYDQVKHLLT